jgi:hypothetical protein
MGGYSMPRQAAAKALAPSLAGLIRVGGQEVVVHDPNTVDAVSADLTTEGREFRGICALAFATVVTTPRASGPSTVEAIVCARLRLSLAGALDLRYTLDKILSKAMPAKRETH